jgi:hypothetical protein
MIRLVSDRQDIKQDGDYNTFFTKLKLLIIMSKAFLNGYPLEEQRLKEITRTAEEVAKDCVDWAGRKTNFRSIANTKNSIQLDYIFFERARLLATIAKSFANGNPVGEHRRMALRRNIDELCRILQYVPVQAQKDSKTA